MNTAESTQIETFACSNCFRQEFAKLAVRTFECAECGELAHKCSACNATTGDGDRVGETCALCGIESNVPIERTHR